MPYQLSWCVPHHVIRYRLYGDLTLDEVTQSSIDYIEMVKSVDGEVHTIVDIAQLEKFPTNLHQVVTAVRFKPEDIRGWAVLVHQANPMVQYTMAMTAQMVLKHPRLRVVNDVQAALDFLREKDSMLDLNGMDIQFSTI
jgi:hypothetical protein